jgi:hypothetical protein
MKFYAKYYKRQTKNEMEVIMKKKSKCVLLLLPALVCLSIFVTVIYAHCDTMSGPVVADAKSALEKGVITGVLKWIKPEHETELKKAFSLTVKIRVQNPESKELADRYFFETLVRLHRAGESAPYTGLKETPPEPIIVMADESLAKGTSDEMIKEIQAHLAAAIKEKFDKALQAGKNKDKNVEAGREYVEAYVQYTHFIEGIHAAIMSTDSHHTENAK